MPLVPHYERDENGRMILDEYGLPLVTLRWAGPPMWLWRTVMVAGVIYLACVWVYKRGWPWQ